MKNFVVFVGLNKTYLDSFYMFLSSYIRNSGIADSDFYIFTDDIEEKDIKINFNFTLISIEKNKYTDYSGMFWPARPLGEAAPLRFDGIDYLKSRYKRGLYLDTDILINGDISKLKEDFKEDLLAITDSEYYSMDPDFFKENHTDIIRYNDREMKFSEKYFNSGVLVINFDTLGNFSFVDEYINSGQKYKYPDQDFLNLCYYDKDVKLLPTTYNAKLGGPLVRNGDISLMIDHRKKMDKSKIIHFDGDKPWIELKGSGNPSVLVALQWPMSVFYREYEYIKHILSDEFKERLAVMNGTLMVELEEFEKQHKAYQRKLGIL